MSECKFCGSIIENGQVDECNYCWEVVKRLDRFLSLAKNRDYMLTKLIEAETFAMSPALGKREGI